MFFKNKKDNLSITDHELITRFRYSHDTRYVGELYTRYTHLVFGTCLKYLENKEDAKDAVMQIFEKILEELKRHDVSNFKFWLYTLSKNYCLMQIRQTKSEAVKMKVYIQSAEIIENSIPEDVEIEHILHPKEEETNKEEKKDISIALKKLNKEQKTCVELFYLEQKTYQEVSEITGYSAKQVKSYIQNGKRNLKTYLKKVDG